MNSRASQSVALYKKLYLLRTADESIRKHYLENEMKTPMHMSMGGEAIAVGVISALEKRDQVFGTYRSHAVYLAKTGETKEFFAELFGKVTGVAKGKAGSMHLSAPDCGLMGSSAVVGTTIPVAVGAAFANKRNRNGKTVAVFFGDGAIDEGVFWESLNLASVWQLPVIFVCEDNGLAIHTHASVRHGYTSITDVVSQFHFNVFEAKTTDVERIHQLTQRAIRTMGMNHKPCFMHLSYYRYLEHVGVSDDFEAGYRVKSEFDAWYKKDPVLLQRKRLLKSGIHESVIQQMEKRIDKQIERSIVLARKAKFPRAIEAFTDLFA